MLGGAFTAAASADDSLVAGLLDGTGDVVEETTDIVEAVAGASESETSTVEVDQTDEQSDSEAVEPVVETTEVVTEVVEPVAETTESAQERGDTDDAPTAQAEAVADSSEQDDQSESESRAPEPDSISLLGQITELIDPITTQLDEIAEPVTGPVITPTVDRVAEGLHLPVVDDVVSPVVSPVLQDVVSPVVDPVVHSALQDVVSPVVRPVVTSVATDAVNPIATVATGEPLPVLVEGVLDTGYRSPVFVANASTVVPHEVVTVPYEVVTMEPVSAAAVEQARTDSELVLSASVEPSVGGPHVISADGTSFVGEPTSSGTAALTEGPRAGESDPKTDPNLPAVPAPAPASNTTSSPAGQGSGTGYADVVGGLLMPANTLTSQAVAEAPSSATEVVLKVAVAPD